MRLARDNPIRRLVGESLRFTLPTLLKLYKQALDFSAGSYEAFPPEVSGRVVEYSFALSNLMAKGGETILDVGCTYPYNVIPAFLANLGYSVYGIDIREFKVSHENFQMIRGDATLSPILNETFDRCLAISTIEHLGLPVYGAKENLDADKKAILEIQRILKPNGKLLLTVPYNKSHCIISSHPTERVYDKHTAQKLFVNTHLRIEIEQYAMRNRKNYWTLVQESEASSVDARNTGETSIMMLRLTKK